ncbi:hypothetical protein ABPG75_011214 [Micractinium tetrahymenae]
MAWRCWPSPATRQARRRGDACRGWGMWAAAVQPSQEHASTRRHCWCRRLCCLAPVIWGEPCRPTSCALSPCSLLPPAAALSLAGGLAALPKFGEQEPATIPEIESFLGERYATKFPLFQKVEVNGEGQQPVFRWLKEQAPPAEGQVQGADIAWNFEKFLIDKAGRPVKRYSSAFTLHEVEQDVYDQLVKDTEHEDL